LSHPHPTPTLLPYTTLFRSLRKSPQGRGVIIAMDPNNGEILALASAPTFDPNLFSQRITSKEGRAEYQKLLNDPNRPLLNRAVQDRKSTRLNSSHGSISYAV